MKLHSERGAVVIHVAIALIALLGFTAVIVDYGAMWVARSQAQAAADAGALAGALTLLEDPTKTALATQAARQFAGAQNAIWGAATADANIDVSPLPFACPASAGGGNGCIRVDVMRGMPGRDGAGHGNTLPTYFGGLVGINTQGVRATATAQVAAGNAVRCIKPLVVADRWADNSGTGSNTTGWDQEDFFNVGIDTYNTAANGYSAAQDVGREMMLKGDGNNFSAGWSLEIDLNGGNGGNVYSDELAGCPSHVPTVGLYAPPTACADVPDTDPEKGCINVKTGVKQGPTTQGVDALTSLDPGAYWDSSTNTVSGGCTSAGTCLSINPLQIGISPRIVPIALFDPQAYASGGFNGNGGMARVVNLLGFFLRGMCDEVYATPPAWCGAHPNQVVVGILMTYPGQGSGVAGPATPASFLKVTRLVQ